MTETAQAVKYDADKPRTDLLPVRPLIDISNVLTFGAHKYQPRNWEKGFDWERAYGAALRHLFAWQAGEDADPETGLNPLAHAACEILFLLEFTHTGAGQDNRPKADRENISYGGTD